MKKLALALTAAAAVVLGSAGVADASAYPPGGQNVTVLDNTVGLGEPVTVTAACTLGETVTFTLVDQTATATCEVAPVAGASVAAGQATGTVNAPTTAGTVTGSVTGSISGALGSFTVTVSAATTPTTPTTPTGGLPATGSDGTQTMTMVAGGILLAGLGMFGVATVRRRQDTAAA